MEELKVSKGTIIRTACLLLAIANNALALFGKTALPVNNETINEVVSFAFTAIAALAAWWKNNSFTRAALEADEVLKSKK